MHVRMGLPAGLVNPIMTVPIGKFSTAVEVCYAVEVGAIGRTVSI